MNKERREELAKYFNIKYPSKLANYQPTKAIRATYERYSNQRKKRYELRKQKENENEKTDELFRTSVFPTKNKIIINPDIVRFNRDIINTTIIQAFCKIKYRPNSIAYEELLNNAMNKYEIYKNNAVNKLRILKVS